MTPREHAVGLYMEGIRDGRPREAVARHTGARYTQHSTGVADGAEGFVAFFEPFIARNPKRDIRVLRTLQQGRYVFAHVFQALNDGADRWVTTDFFDSDDEGRIIEHWDVIAPFVAANAAGRSNIGGPTAIGGAEATAGSMRVVAGFVDNCLLGGKIAPAGAIIAGDLIEHAPDRGDGADAFIRARVASDAPVRIQDCVLMVAEGQFVATLSRATRHGAEICLTDLFRVENDRIVSHWENEEPVPPRGEWVNSGKF